MPSGACVTNLPTDKADRANNILIVIWSLWCIWSWSQSSGLLPSDLHSWEQSAHQRMLSMSAATAAGSLRLFVRQRRSGDIMIIRGGWAKERKGLVLKIVQHATGLCALNFYSEEDEEVIRLTETDFPFSLVHMFKMHVKVWIYMKFVLSRWSLHRFSAWQLTFPTTFHH